MKRFTKINNSLVIVTNFTFEKRGWSKILRIFSNNFHTYHFDRLFFVDETNQKEVVGSCVLVTWIKFDRCNHWTFPFAKLIHRHDEVSLSSWFWTYFNVQTMAASLPRTNKYEYEARCLSIFRNLHEWWISHF